MSDQSDCFFLAGLSPLGIPEDLGEDVWDMLEATALVERDPLLRQDFLDGLRVGCRNEVYGYWQGLHYEADVWHDQGLHFQVRAKGERAQERRVRFQELERAVNGELKRLIPVFRPYQQTSESERRSRRSGLA
jgi:hypothetical protein